MLGLELFCVHAVVRQSLVTAASIFILVGLMSTEASANELYKWVQYAPGGIEARAVTDAAACPPASIDGVPAVMSERSAPGENFPVRACTLSIPMGAKLVTVADAPLPLPKARPDRILIIGDTGCQLGKQVQACNDMTDWPFRLNADMGASFKPDIVLHVGDIRYRDKDCPIGNSGCAGSPFGDTWEAWKADFFKPAEALLSAAPWVVVRGNHEDCKHGSKGWARTLDPYPFDPKAEGCVGPQKPYTVDIGGVTLLVIDASMVAKTADDEQAAWYRSQFQSAASVSGPVWLAIHRPIWAVDNISSNKKNEDDKTLAVAARNAIPGNVQAIISGHHHTFGVMSYVQDLPVQVVSGHGGADLSPHAPDVVKGLRIGGVQVKDGIGRPHVFGFSMIERVEADPSGKTWKLTGYDTQGHPIGACQIKWREVICDESTAR